jgi:hypothetical protein
MIPYHPYGSAEVQSEIQHLVAMDFFKPHPCKYPFLIGKMQSLPANVLRRMN